MYLEARLKTIIQKNDPLPDLMDFHYRLINNGLYGVSNDFVHTIIKTQRKLGLRTEPSHLFDLWLQGDYDLLNTAHCLAQDGSVKLVEQTIASADTKVSSLDLLTTKRREEYIGKIRKTAQKNEYKHHLAKAQMAADAGDCQEMYHELHQAQNRANSFQIDITPTFPYIKMDGHLTCLKKSIFPLIQGQIAKIFPSRKHISLQVTYCESLILFAQQHIRTYLSISDPLNIAHHHDNSLYTQLHGLQKEMYGAAVTATSHLLENLSMHQIDLPETTLRLRQQEERFQAKLH